MGKSRGINRDVRALLWPHLSDTPIGTSELARITGASPESTYWTLERMYRYGDVARVRAGWRWLWTKARHEYTNRHGKNPRSLANLTALKGRHELIAAYARRGGHEHRAWQTPGRERPSLERLWVMKPQGDPANLAES